jgi:hypothetical protein
MLLVVMLLLLLLLVVVVMVLGVLVGWVLHTPRPTPSHHQTPRTLLLMLLLYECLKLGVGIYAT